MPTVITLTTDFGDSSYVGQLKGALLCVVPDACIVDITHSIPPQNIIAGAIALADSAPHFPDGTIHIAVVDPGVGTDRALVAARMDHSWVIGPDNGLLSDLAAVSRNVEAVVLNRPEFWSPKVSRIFHGRDIMASVAGHLSRGVLLSDLGSGPHRLKPSCVPVARISSSSAAGRTLFADSYGNLITNLKEDSLPSPKPDGLKVLVNDGRIAVNWVGTYGEAHPGALVALLGSSGRIELSQVNGNASKVFPTIGTTIEIRW